MSGRPSSQKQPRGGHLLIFPPLPPPGALPAVKKTDALSSTGRSVPNRRRSHRKSRTGCRICKERRVKCDETMPQCRRCQIYGITCDFAPPQTSPQRNGALALDAMTANVNNVLDSDRRSPAVATSNRSLGLATLIHFTEMVGARQTAYAPIKQVLRDRTIPLALTEPCLLNAMLAVASTHQANLTPGDSHRSLVATRFRQASVHIYRLKLQEPITRHTMDVLLTTCLLVAMFSFSAPSVSPRHSWIFSDDPGALNWLLIQGGLASLIDCIMPWINESIWCDAFLISSAYELYDDHRTGREGLDEELADLCEISDTTTEETNPYHWPLRMLSPLLRLPLTKIDANRISSFMGRLPPEYLRLVQARDARALLLLGYWLAVMCSVHDWWIDARVRSECQAICMYLEASGDRRIARFLDFPASACGYRAML
ncbi:Zn(II)2Cys6 transcription factor [Aspergillus affinis]|uniref:Zn(II)2Cys6 transcription factor n=1 Tax=Aspergillus affinis TaxID=1070780 RepID=UPI0022FF0996|nr:putative C6 transcription factor [Aspergillus affinis]KAI9041821.1 putative C6 transcription factor [Aspergillus affinis]